MLEENWWKDAFGPVLAYTKDGDEPTALLPDRFSGYYFFDREKGKKINNLRKLTKRSTMHVTEGLLL